MNGNQERSGSGRLHRLVIAVIACGAVAAPVAFAHPLGNLILVPPKDLPELAQQSGEAMLLQERLDGRPLLYIEQSQGAGIAVLDTKHRHDQGASTAAENTLRPNRRIIGVFSSHVVSSFGSCPNRQSPEIHARARQESLL
jgi:hypothetical protein